MKGKTWINALIISLVVGTFVSLVASSSPDGLEYVAEQHGFINAAVNHISGLVPDYAFPGISNEYIATAFAGLFGTAATFLLLYFIGKALFPVSEKAGQKR